MLFLGPLYQIVETHYATRINHFPLVRLVFLSLDKTILYLLIFFLLRAVWLRVGHRKIQWRHELGLFLFATYLILLLMLTVFRSAYWPWQLTWYWHRSFSVINFKPLVETFKLYFAQSRFDFWYQSVGNIGWFLPFGYGITALAKRRYHLGGVLVRGALFSLMIEALQFLLATGVSDIDDVIFNTIGAMCGYGLYRLWHHRR